MNYEKFLAKSSFLGVASCKLITSKEGISTGIKFLNINDAFEKLTGLNRRDFIGQPFKKNNPDSELPVQAWMDAYHDVVLNGGEKQLEQFISASQKWVKAYVSSQEKNYFSVVLIDITEEKSEYEELEHFFLISPNLHCIADLDGRLLKINTAWTDTLGYDEEKLRGELFLNFVHPDDVENTLNAIRSLKEGKQVINFVNRYRSKDKTYRYLEWFSMPKGDYIYAVARDVTERKRKEASVYRERELLRAIIKNSPDSIYVKDSKARKIMANPVDCYYSGVEKEENLIGKTDFDLFSKEEANKFFEIDQRVLKDGEVIKNIEEKITRPNGENIWLLTSKIPLRDAEDNVTGLLGIGRDITKRRTAEMERKEYVDRIEQLSQHLPGFIYQFLLQPDGSVSIPYVSGNLKKYFGVSNKEVGQSVSSVFKVIHPDDLNLVKQSIAKSADRMSPWHESFRVIIGEDDTVWLEGHATPEKKDDGSTLWHGYIQDITDRKLAEESLHYERSMFAKGPVFTIERSPDGDRPIRYVSENVEQIMGYSVGELKNPFFSFKSLIHPDDRERILDESRSNNQNNVDHFEQSYRLRCKDGEYRWFYDFTKVDRNEQGRIIGIRGYMYDHTGQKETEFELQKERTRLQNIISGTNAGTWEWNVRTGETIFNERWAEMIGYTLEQLSPINIKTWEKLTHPDDLKKAGKLLDDHFSGKTDYYEMELRMKHKDGRWIWVLDRGRIAQWAENGDPLWMLGTHIDITRRKQNEYAIRESEEKFRQITENIEDVFWLESADHSKIIYVSQAYETLFDRSCQSLYKNPASFLDSILDEDKHRVIEAHNRYTDTGYFDVIYRLVRPNGSIRWIRSRMSKILDEKGNLIRHAGIAIDVTAQKEAEMQLEKLSVAVEQSPSSVIITNPDGVIEYVNSKFVELTGYSSSEAVGKKPSILKSGKQSDEFYQKLWGTISSGKPWRGDLLNKRKNGELFWESASITPLIDDQGNITHFLGVKEDITSRKRAELEISRMSRIMKNSQTIANLGSFEHVAENQTTNWSEQQYHIYGIDPNDPPPDFNELLEKYIHPDDVKTVQDAFAAALKNKKDYELEHRIVKPDGEVRWVYDKVQPYVDDNGYLTRIVGVTLDITDRKKAEQDLLISKKRIEESEEKYRAIFEKGLVSIIVADDYGKYLSANRAACELLGYTAEELHGMSVRDIKTKDEYTAENRYKKYISRGEETGEFEFITKSGEHKIAFYKATRIRKDFNISMLIDITEQNKIEKKLVAAKQQAEHANKAKSQFLAKMSHELRTPLNGVIGFTDILSGTELTPVQKQYVESANVSGQNLLRIINDILDLSKIEAGMLELDIVHTDINQILENSVDIVKVAADRKNLELLLDLDPALPKQVLLDPVRLTQVLSNLLGNAIKFTNIGEVELRAEYHSTSKNRGVIHVSVRDTGIGISAEQEEKLFKVFSQADSSTTRRYGGTGLGLAISQHIAGMMGTRINFESRPGEGSRFFFDMEVETAGGASQKELDVSLKRCLIADDNARNREILSSILSDCGLNVVECNSGREAINILESDPDGFDLFICDNGIPGMNGRDTVEIVRNKIGIGSETLRIVLLFTSSDKVAVRTDCLKRENTCCIDKPVKRGHLFRCLNGETDVLETSNITGPKSKTDQPETRTAKILIAEDVSMNMQLISTLLKSSLPHVELLKAKDGEHAVKLFKKGNPDLVLMDVQMPLMDGVEATRKIRKLDRHTGHHTPIVALTAAALKEDRQNCLNAGMDDVLTKPIEPSKLKQVLAEYLPGKGIL